MITKKQILIVENEVITAIDIQRRLTKLGYDVPVIVGSGEEAIKKVIENKPDLVLMDIGLNGDMDGFQTASKICSMVDIPVIYLTAYYDTKTLEQANISEYSHISKPFHETELRKKLELALSRGSN
ncbi:MAG: response regulator [Candidatus Methanoperedens sp.]|nr:response regulator [Candidatus Methanoperedens sp.]